MRARGVLLYGVAAVVGITGATLIYAPAGIAAWMVGKASNGSVAIVEPYGTFWRGGGDLVVQGARGPLRVPGFSWAVQPGRLWRGELAAAVRAQGPDINGSAELGRSVQGVALRRVLIHAPIRLLAANVPVLQPLGPSGGLTLRTDALTVDASAVTGSADVLIEHAESARYGTLGDYRIALDGMANGAALTVTTLHGPLHVEGSGEVNLAGQLRFRGRASADESERERFGPVLAFIGVPRPDGSVPLEWPLSGAGNGLRGTPVVSAN